MISSNATKKLLKNKVKALAKVPRMKTELLAALADGGRGLHPSIRQTMDDPEAVRKLVANPRYSGPVSVPDLEAIVLGVGRPVLLVLNDTFSARFEEPESTFWTDVLNAAMARINAAIPSVGRIELVNHDSYRWVGTGWVVEENVVVTNRTL